VTGVGAGGDRSYWWWWWVLGGGCWDINILNKTYKFSPQVSKVTLLTQKLTMLVLFNDGSNTESVLLSWEW